MKISQLIPIPLKQRLRRWIRGSGKILRGEHGIADVLYSSSSSFSQFGEDILLSQLLWYRKNGFYVDVGAYDPCVISNTFLFYRNGWRGINIEPNPQAYRRFLKCRRRDINLQVAVSAREQPVTFTCDGVFSGIEDASYLFRHHHPHSGRIIVQAKPLRLILEEHLPPAQEIDFLSVDCEGHDIEVLKSNDWRRFRPLVVLVEDHEKLQSWTPQDVLEAEGYSLYCRLRLTKIFLRQDFEFR